MIKRIDYSKTFIKQLNKAPLKIKIAFKKKLLLFVRNPFNSQLRNHGLTGKLSGLRSINVTGDWRAIFLEVEGGAIIKFVLLGTHSQLYT